jgi:hypothetical protein
MLVTLSTKDYSPGVKYSRPVKMKVAETFEERALFLAKALKEEVIQGTEKQQLRKVKQLKKLLKLTLTVGVVGLKMSPKAFANSTAPLVAGSTALTPATIMQYGLSLALISVSVGVAIAMIMLTVAGIYRMFRKRELADMWVTDIIKGLVQVLIAIPTVYLLFYLAQLVFKNLPVLSGLF